MHTSGTILVFFAAVAGSVAPLAGQAPTASPVTISSPDGKVRAEVDAANGVLRYRILVDGKQVLAPSKLGIEADDVELGQDVTLGSPHFRKVDQHYRSSDRTRRLSIAPTRRRFRHNRTVSPTRSTCMWPTMASACGYGFRPRQDEGAGR